MNNEIGRKITSLTLMTIMIAGGMTFALPGVMPAAHAQANANLFVSVEESFSPDRFGGPMVVEVVVNDPDLKDTDEAETEPDVTVNGKTVRMVQASDGNWYAYIMDRTMALAADKLPRTGSTSLDYGIPCSAAAAAVTSPALLGGFTDTVGVVMPYDDGVTANSTGLFSPALTCAPEAALSPDLLNNVIRENKTMTQPVAVPLILSGQIGVQANAWPFIQLYDFTAGGDAKIVYNIGGGSPQTVTLEFDDSLDDYGKLTADRTSYPQGAHVHATISDNWLNVDPTDEDSWTFGSNALNGSTVYQAFDENGANAGVAIADGSANLIGNLSTINAGDLGVLKIDPDPNNSPVDSIIDLFDNDDQNIIESLLGPAFVTTPLFGSQTLGTGTAPVTFVETEASTGIFLNTDESDNSNIRIATDAPRGTTSTIDYNDSATSLLVANFFGTMNMDATPLGGEWNSGEEIPVTLTDQDQNLNSKVDEDLSVANATFPLIPSLQIGSPITLEGLGGATGNVAIGGIADLNSLIILPAGTTNTVTVDLFSQRANLGTSVPIDVIPFAGLQFITGKTVDDVAAFTNNGTEPAKNSKFSYLNYDLRSFSGALQGPLRFELRE